MRSEIYIKMLAKLRASKGCTIDDLEKTLPEEYMAIDAPLDI